MRKSYGIAFAAALLAATPAFAGNLSYDNGQTEWHSSQCTKPNPPASIVAAHPGTSGDDMNSLMAQHNAYVDAAQNYMNCISAEADRDQTLSNQTIATGAQKAISDTQSELEQETAALRTKNK